MCLCFFLTNDILFKHKTTPAAWFYNLYHQHIISSTHQHIKFINTSSPHILYHFVDFVFKSGGIININIIAVIEF